MTKFFFYYARHKIIFRGSILVLLTFAASCCMKYNNVVTPNSSFTKHTNDSLIDMIFN